MTENCYELLFDYQQIQAKGRFFNAKPFDGYWYLIDKDGNVISRNKIRQINIKVMDGAT